MLPPSPAGVPAVTPSGFGGGGGAGYGYIPQALEAVIAHRVLPLFVRTLRSWSAIVLTPPFLNTHSPNQQRYSNKNAGVNTRTLTARPATAYAGAIARALQIYTERGTRQRQREAVALGVLDALVSWLRWARSTSNPNVVNKTAVPIPFFDAAGGQQASSIVGRRCTSPGHVLAAGDEAEGVALAAEAAALHALAAMCSSCEDARERILQTDFHSSIELWLFVDRRPNAMAVVGQGDSDSPGNGRAGRDDGGGGFRQSVGVSAQCAALLLVRNLGRSSIACAALARAGVHHSVIGHLLQRRRRDGKEEDEEARKVRTLAASALANLCLEHGLVKQAIVESNCLQLICSTAVDVSADEQVRAGWINEVSGCFSTLRGEHYSLMFLLLFVVHPGPSNRFLPRATCLLCGIPGYREKRRNYCEKTLAPIPGV